MGQYLTSHCYIKAAIPEARRSPAADGCCSRISPNECEAEMQLKASYLSFSVGSCVVSPLSACLGRVQLSTRRGLEMTSQLLTRVAWPSSLKTSSPSLSRSLALGSFPFPQQPTEASKTVLKTSAFQINSAHISPG